MRTVCKLDGWKEACGNIAGARESRGTEREREEGATFRAIERARRKERRAEGVLWAFAFFLAAAAWFEAGKAILRWAFGG